MTRTDNVLRSVGCESPDDLRGKLQPAFDQAARGELQQWNVDEFLARMHERQNTKTE